MARENGREPKNPRAAESGLGWALAMIGVSPSIGARDWASRPQRIATSGVPRATSARMAWSVTASHPLPRCEAGAPGRTVSTLLSSMTPCVVQGLRSPFAGRGTPTSEPSSVKMFARLRGSGATCGWTEKHRPMGWPGVGYGSWPTMSTRTSSNDGDRNARSTALPAGR